MYYNDPLDDFMFGFIIFLLGVSVFLLLFSIANKPVNPDNLPSPAKVCQAHRGVKSFNDEYVVCLDGFSGRAYGGED